MAIDALIRYIDGGASTYSVDDRELDHLDALLSEGLTGKTLIDAWITDDWAAPPTDVVIRGVTSTGRSINQTLFYD